MGYNDRYVFNVYDAGVNGKGKETYRIISNDFKENLPD